MFAEVVARAKRRECKIITSALTLVECLESKLPVGMDRLFKDMLKRVNRLSMDIKVAELAHDIRDYYTVRANEFSGKKLTTPDAIHLAAAILYRADEFHTFDDGQERFEIHRPYPAIGQCRRTQTHNMQASRKKSRPRSAKAGSALTDAERHKRFIEMAREVGASDDPKAFDSAFKRVVGKPKPRKGG